MDLTFSLASQADEKLVQGWLQKPYVREWFYGEGLESTLQHLRQFVRGEASLFQHWIARSDLRPFAFLMTSDVVDDDDLRGWCTTKGPTITLDLLIGEEDFLGRGVATPMIRAFLDQQFPKVREVLIDPEARNARAIHVYEKAGFHKLGEFTPESGAMKGIPHLMMHFVR